MEGLMDQVRRLMEDHRRLRVACDEVAKERDALRTENRALGEQLKLTKKELAVAQLGGGLVGGDPRRGRDRVNELIREVDRCIKLASR